MLARQRDLGSSSLSRGKRQEEGTTLDRYGDHCSERTTLRKKTPEIGHIQL